MRWWPFGERNAPGESTEDSEGGHRTITLYQTDSDLERARKILMAAGLGLGPNTLGLLVGAAEAIGGYRRLDDQARRQDPPSKG